MLYIINVFEPFAIQEFARLPFTDQDAMLDAALILLGNGYQIHITRQYVLKTAAEALTVVKAVRDIPIIEVAA